MLLLLMSVLVFAGWCTVEALTLAIISVSGATAMTVKSFPTSPQGLRNIRHANSR